MPALAFRRRILLAMLVFGVLPTTLGIIGWAMALRNRAPAMAGRAAFEEVGATGRHFLRVLDTTRLTAEEKAALREHTSELNSAMAQPTGPRRSAGIVRSEYDRHHPRERSRLHLRRDQPDPRPGSSAPIDELVGWTGFLRRGAAAGERQPSGRAGFAALRQAFPGHGGRNPGGAGRAEAERWVRSGKWRAGSPTR
jgi:hypothetical protein